MNLLLSKPETRTEPDVKLEDQPAWRALLSAWLEAKQAFDAACKRYVWCENILDPHRRRWVERTIPIDEELDARVQRTAIAAVYHQTHQAFTACQTQQEALRARLQKEILAQRQAGRLALVRELGNVLKPTVAANEALIRFEQDTEQLTHTELSDKFSWPTLHVARLNEWHRIIEHETR